MWVIAEHIFVCPQTGGITGAWRWLCPCDEDGFDITKGLVSIKCVESIDKKRAGKDNPRLRYSSNSGYVAQLVRAQHS